MPAKSQRIDFRLQQSGRIFENKKQTNKQTKCSRFLTNRQEAQLETGFFLCRAVNDGQVTTWNGLTSISSSLRALMAAVLIKSMRMCTTRAKWRRCYRLELDQSNKVASQWIFLLVPYFKKKKSLLSLCPTSWLEQFNCNKLPGFRARISSNWHRFPSTNPSIRFPLFSRVGLFEIKSALN